MKTLGAQNLFARRWAMTRWAKEPLVHFAVIGGLLFGVYAWLNRRAAEVDENPAHVIRISAGEVDWLKETWTRQWRRPPTQLELKGLVEDLLREEMLCREARAMGLDQDDIIVRRRLAQKMTFLLTDIGSVAQPS